MSEPARASGSFFAELLWVLGAVLSEASAWTREVADMCSSSNIIEAARRPPHDFVLSQVYGLRFRARRDNDRTCASQVDGSAQTTLISKNGVVTIADFLSELQSQGNKADDLLLGKGRVSGNIQTNVDICFSHPTNRSTFAIVNSVTNISVALGNHAQRLQRLAPNFSPQFIQAS